MDLISPRPVYTLSFRLPRQTLWDIPQPLLPLPRCSLFACHLSSAQRAPPARHNREESILLGATDRRNLLVLPRPASRRCPPPAICFSVRFLIPALLRAVGPPTSLFQDLLASLAKVAFDEGEINRSPQSL
jgi:hypothetical protein